MASLKLAIHKVGVKRGEIFEKTVKAKEGVEEKYESLLKSRGTWIWEVDEKGFCKSCSTKVSYALGYKPDEMIGKKIFEFMVPEEAKKYINIFSEITRTKQDYPYTLDSYWLHKDGHNVSVHTQFVPIFDDSGNFRGFRGFARDMIEYKNDEEKIEDLNKKLVYANGRMHENIDEHEKSKDILPRETALDKLNEEEFDYMFIFDENANIIDCNPDVYKKLGYKKDEMLSLNLADFDYLETKKDIQEKINKIKKSGSINFKTIHKKKDGSSVFVSENIQYLKDKNMFRCIVKEDFVA